MTRKLTTAEFIERAKKVHGDRYDYSKSRYIDVKTKVEIVCHNHGSFWQTPDNHINNARGCKQCAIDANAERHRGSKEEFVSRARSIHGEKYDYSEVVYFTSNRKVVIRCPVHGNFEQIPSSHLQGYGCPTCGRNLVGKQNALTQDEFIKLAENKHNGFYDYSEINYRRTIDKITIICPKHGPFRQTPNAHLSQGQGCPACKIEKLKAAFTHTRDQFIKKAREVHGDKYDYTEVDYRGYKGRVKITCPEHGSFEQMANIHLSGSGCPACASYGLNVNQPGILYYLRIETRNQTFWKIGITHTSVGDRFGGIDMKHITALKVWHYEKLRMGLDKETEILNQYSEYLYIGNEEPLKRGGNSELFTRDVLGLDPEHM